VRSPLLAIADYERELGLPKDYLNVMITRRGDSGAWQKFERGEIPLLHFYEGFSRELSDLDNGNPWFREHCARRKIDVPVLPTHLEVDGRELFGRMMRESAKYDDLVVRAIRKIRASGKYRVIALTNSFKKSPDSLIGKEASPPIYAHLTTESELSFLGWHAQPTGANGASQNIKELFDDFIDSSEVGLRKPDPAFYLYACDRNGIKPTQVVFLDDLGMNLRAARQLGIETIHVRIGKSETSIRELGKKLELDLVEERPKL